MSRRQSGKPKRGSLLGGTLRSDDPNTADEPFPDVEKARLHAEAQLPKDPTTGKIFPRGCELAAFQTFGLSIFAYMTLLEQWFFSCTAVQDRTRLPHRPQGLPRTRRRAPPRH